MRFGVWEIAIIVLLVVILFGHNKIPNMMKNLAEGLKIFKKELKNSPKANEKQVAKKSVAGKKAAKKPVAKKK
jgi:TatA/E family protein of Tat protein translocase